MRDLTQSMIDALENNTGEVVYFIRFFNIEGSTGTDDFRFCTAGQGLDWGGEYWQPGAAISVGAIKETGDIKAERVDVGVGSIHSEGASSFISNVLSNNTVGRKCKIWMAYLTPSGVVSDPLGAFVGYLNDSWEIKSTETDGRKSVIVKTSVVSRLAELEEVMAIRTNQQSYIRHKASRGWFFEFTPSLKNAKFYWGSDKPPEDTIWDRIPPIDEL